MNLHSLAPEASASANSATSAYSIFHRSLRLTRSAWNILSPNPPDVNIFFEKITIFLPDGADCVKNKKMQTCVLRKIDKTKRNEYNLVKEEKRG